MQLLTLLKEPAAGAADDQQTQRGQQEVAAGDDVAARAAVSAVELEGHQGGVAAEQETGRDPRVEETQHRERTEVGDVGGDPANRAEGRRQLA